MRKSAMTYLFSCNLVPPNISINSGTKQFQWLPGFFVLPFLCCHFAYIPATLLAQKTKKNIEKPWPPGRKTQSDQLQEDQQGHQHRRGTDAQAALFDSSLVLNANVQLRSDFFLRTSCGSPNNDCRGLPPLSLLKYGNCIIPILEPLFSHG